MKIHLQICKHTLSKILKLKRPSCNETPRSLLALKKWAHGARRSALGARRTSGAVCFGWGSLLWVHGAWVGSLLWAHGAWRSSEAVCFGCFALAPRRLECLSYRLVVSCDCQLFVTNPKTFTAFAYFINILYLSDFLFFT